METGTKHTYGWYTLHQFRPGGTYFETGKYGDPVNAPSNRTNLENLRTLGVVDQVPTVDNFRPLIQMYHDWWETVEVSWSNYTREEGKPLVTLHWILSQVIQDPTTDPEIIRLALQVHPRNAISCVYNPSCPEDIIVDLLNGCGSKTDTTRETKGGDISCFVLHNPLTPAHLVDLSVKKTRKASTQKSGIGHPNVSRETLVYLVNHGKSDAVKRDALLAMYEKGWLKVE